MALLGKRSDMSAPWNFSWVVQNQLAAMSCPSSEGNMEYLWQNNIRHLITLSPEQLPATNVPKLERTIISIEEFEAPSLEDINKFIDICEKCILENKAVGIHCRMGRGRTGVMAACYLVHFQECHPQSAIAIIRQQRPGSIETIEQERAVHRYHDLIRGTRY